MLSFDWLIHSGRVLALCHKIMFSHSFFAVEKQSLKTKIRKKKKIGSDCEGNTLYLRQYCYSSDSYVKEIP